jgi:hypothetical protein
MLVGSYTESMYSVTYVVSYSKHMWYPTVNNCLRDTAQWLDLLCTTY